MSRSSIFKLSDGRRAQFLDAGAQNGKVLVLHHGTPSESGVWKIWDKAAVQLGVRLVCVTRPGYADSDEKPGRKVLDVASDIQEVLDYLDVDSFVTVGWSGGGPHALACAAMLKDRCRAVATLAGVAPHGVAGLDFLEGMGEENIREFTAAMKGRAALSEWMKGEGAAHQTVTPESLFEALGSLLPPVDQKVLTGELVRAIADTVRLALKNGFHGWIDDDLAFVNPWGFDVQDISVPAVVWQGNLDKMVPLTHGRWLSQQLRGCVSKIGSNEGHISLLAGRERDIIQSVLDIASV